MFAHLFTYWYFYFGIPLGIFSLMLITLLIALFVKENGQVTVKENSFFYRLRFANMVPYAVVQAFFDGPDSISDYFWHVRVNAKNLTTSSRSLCTLFWTQFVGFFFMLPINVIIVALALGLLCSLGPPGTALFGIFLLGKYLVIGTAKYIISPLIEYFDRLRREAEEKSSDAKKNFLTGMKFGEYKESAGTLMYRLLINQRGKKTKDVDYLNFLEETILKHVDSLKKGSLGFAQYVWHGSTMLTALRNVFVLYPDQDDIDIAYRFYNATTEECQDSRRIKKYSRTCKRLHRWLSDEGALIALEHYANSLRDTKNVEEAKSEKKNLRKLTWAKRWQMIVDFYDNNMCPTIIYEREEKQ